MVEPGPVPMATAVEAGRGNGQEVVRVSVATPVGVLVLFYPADAAEDFGRKLVEAARLARTGLVIAGGTAERPDARHG